MERMTAALSRLYEGGQGFDLQRFLRDLPLATAQLAAQERTKSQPPPAQKSTPPVAEPAAAEQTSAETPPAEAAPAPEASSAAEAAPAPEAAPPAEAPAA